MFRKLRADEIDVRVGSVTSKGASLLLYKDARCDMNVLDESVGKMRWKRDHSRDNANCTVSIWCKELQQWISKEDVGTESNTEKEKGLASDSFKRACVNWGIGRELYSAPFIFANCEVEVKNNKNVLKGHKKFKCSHIAYDESGNISELIIIDEGNKSVFNYSLNGKKSAPAPATTKKEKAEPTPAPKVEVESEPKVDKKQKAILLITKLSVEKNISMNLATLKDMSESELKEIYQKMMEAK